MAGDDVCLSPGGIVGPHIILFLKRLLRREIVLGLCDQVRTRLETRLKSCFYKIKKKKLL